MSRTQDLRQSVDDQLKAIENHIPAVREAAKEKGNKLVDESLEILGVCTRTLESLISTEAANSLPVPALTQIIKHLTNAANTTTAMAGAFDGNAGNFTNQVDALHYRLWSDNLIDPGVEVEAYQSATGRLQRSMEEAHTDIAELRKGLEDRKQVEKAAEEANALLVNIELIASDLAHRKKELDNLSEDAAAIYKTFQSTTSENKNLFKESQKSRLAIAALEQELVKWHADIEVYRGTIEDLRDSTDTKLKTYDAEVEERKRSLDEFEEKISDQFKLASSGALAKSFDTRGRALLAGKLGWGALAVLSYLGFIGFAVWLMRTTIPVNGSEFNWPLFAIRISVAFSIGLLVWFVTLQFGIARRVQESYAFKGTVASSFDAYRDLVARITKDPELKERPEYADFIRETIKQIYHAPPMGKEDDDQLPHARLLKDLAPLLRTLTEIQKATK